MASLPADFTQSDGSRSVAVRLLDAAGGRGALSGRLGSQLLPRGFATSRLTGRLLRTRHFLTDFSLTLHYGTKPGHFEASLPHERGSERSERASAAEGASEASSPEQARE